MANDSTLADTVYTVSPVGSSKLARKRLPTGSVLLYLFTSPDAAGQFAETNARGRSVDVRPDSLARWANRGLVWALLDGRLCNVQSAASEANRVLPVDDRAAEDARVMAKVLDLSLELGVPLEAFRLQDCTRRRAV